MLLAIMLAALHALIICPPASTSGLLAERRPSPARVKRSGTGVRCKPLILMEAPAPAYRRGTAGEGQITSRRGGALRRTHAERLAHRQKTKSPYHLPAIGKKRASTAKRDGVVERFPAAAVQNSIAVDLALMGHDDHLLGDGACSILTTAKQPHAQTHYLLRTVPGIGAILHLRLLDDIHDIGRCPRVQDVVSYGRLVKCTKASAGKRSGTSGTKIGNASRKWAFAAAAGLFPRDHPAGQQYLTTREKTPGTGKALTIRAHQRGRAVYAM
jgi:transposase